MLLLFSIRVAKFSPFGKEPSILFTVLVFVNFYQCVCGGGVIVSFPFGFKDGMWDLII